MRKNDDDDCAQKEKKEEEVKLDWNFLLSWLKKLFSHSLTRTLCSLIFLLTKCRKRQRVEQQENMWNWKIKPTESERAKTFYHSATFLTRDRSIRKELWTIKKDWIWLKICVVFVMCIFCDNKKIIRKTFSLFFSISQL